MDFFKSRSKRALLNFTNCFLKYFVIVDNTKVRATLSNKLLAAFKV